MSRVPAYEKYTTDSTSTTQRYPVLSALFPLQNGTLSHTFTVPNSQEILSVTFQWESDTNLDRDNVVIEQEIISATQYKTKIMKFLPKNWDRVVEIRNRVSYRYVVSTETVFKIKHNGAEYDKIKLNGEVVTPKE